MKNKKVEVPEVPKRQTIAELEAMLNKEEENSIEILPNGEVRAVIGKPKKRSLTMWENLGGEYGEVA